jgi:preprotein translocase subunit SecY
MAYCPNPDCPHRKEMGYPAEFREGITHCSDCGSLLSEEVNEMEDLQKPSPKITLTDLHKRILYTIGFVIIYRVLLLIPLPGINLEALNRFFSDVQFSQLVRFFGSEPSLERFSVFALGILPYAIAYMIIEILSVFVQPLKTWRSEGYQGRIKIKRVALFIPCYLRGYYHRALLYFFGPYIEISVLVPQEKIADAREIIENYFDANVLTAQ